MIIKNIVFKDFRKFKGKQEIVFSTGNIKDFTVIFGVNTSGKTTIIDAFKWCLYDISKLPIVFLPNAETVEALESMQDENVYVEINLIYKNIQYKIKREITYFRNDNNKVVIKKSGVTVSYKDKLDKEIVIEEYKKEDIINQISLKELLESIFVNGETFYHIDRKLNHKDILKRSPKSDLIAELEKEIDLVSNLNKNTNDDIFSPVLYPVFMDEPFECMKNSDIDCASKAISRLSRQVILFLKENTLSYLSKDFKEKTGYIYEIYIINNSPTYSIIEENKFYIL